MLGGITERTFIVRSDNKYKTILKRERDTRSERKRDFKLSPKDFGGHFHWLESYTFDPGLPYLQG